MGVGGQLCTSDALPLEKRPGMHGIGGWMGPRAGLDRWRESRPPPEFYLRTIQPIASPHLVLLDFFVNI